MMRVARFQVSWQGSFGRMSFTPTTYAPVLGQGVVGFLYDKVWVVNIHTYEWNLRALRHPLKRLGVMPLSLVLGLAHKVCIFSDLTQM